MGQASSASISPTSFLGWSWRAAVLAAHGDQAIYKDPATGQNVQLSNQYSHAWASTTGNTNGYILTDSATYNPNGQAGSASWTRMQPQN